MIGEGSVSCLSLISGDCNIHPITSWSLFLLVAFLCMLLYEVYWIRYFTGKQTMKDVYRSLFGIPLAGATLPVMAFFLLGVYGKQILLLIAAVILGIGHIGIHHNHKKELEHENL